MNPIFQGLSQGYTPQQILKYLSKAFPAMATPISQATSSGYNAKQILGFLSKNFDTEDRRGMSTSQRRGANIRADAERTKHGLSLLGGAVAIPFAAQAAQSALARALPSSLQHGAGQVHGTTNATNAGAGSGGIHTLGTQPVPNQAPNPVQNANPSLQPPVVNQPGNLTGQQTPNPAQLPSQPVNTPNIPQTAPIQQPQVNAINATKVLSNSKSKDEIDSLIKQGYNPKQISAYFQKFHSSEIKKIEKEAGDTFEKVAEQYIAENPPVNQQPESTELVEEPINPAESIPKDAITPPIQTNEKPHEIKKSSIVSSPQGVGEVKEIRNGQAIVEIDGKLHKVKEDELEGSPLPEKELADLHEDLIRGIEQETGEEVSRHVTLVGYDPNTRELDYMPWRGRPYIFKNVTDEELAKLKDKINRKTSGENFIGAYEADTESPIGAAMSEFMLARKQAEKDKEIEKKEKVPKEKYQKLYYAYESAEKAAEDRDKERKKQAKKNPRVP